MGGNPLREVLNRLRWEPGADVADVVLRHVSRTDGEAGTVEIAFSRVAEVLPAGVTLADGTFVPYHRVVAVVRGGETVWHAAPEEEAP